MIEDPKTRQILNETLEMLDRSHVESLFKYLNNEKTYNGLYRDLRIFAMIIESKIVDFHLYKQNDLAILKELVEIEKNKNVPDKIYPWWRKDSDGWPIEYIEGRPVHNILRTIFQNIKKLKED